MPLKRSLTFAALALLQLAPAAAAAPPHIVYALIDDFGWANAGWHRDAPDNEVATPNMNELVKQGVELNRFYAHKFCGPSRAALQTGRLPIHVTVLDDNLADNNPKDPDGGYQGIPRNMTGIAVKLKAAGYSTAMAGKAGAPAPPAPLLAATRPPNLNVSFLSFDSGTTASRPPTTSPRDEATTRR